jgi:ABC-2 type transport system ATP-binding protein
MTAVIEVDRVTKRFGKVTALDDVSFTIEENRITGLLGRNGAGKTTLMQLVTGQDFTTEGAIRVFGQSPVENADVLQRISFIKESQRYPDDFRVKHVFRTAPWFFAHWDADFAARLIEEFRLPLDRRIKKLTFFDEPYLGLDAVARQLFYDRLLEDYAEHPRTIVLSTHLIDEVSALLEHVILLERGRILLDQDADDLRGSATSVVGVAKAVDAFAQGRSIIAREGIGGLASVTIDGLDAEGRAAATAAGLELVPVSLQQLVIKRTNTTEQEFEATA